MLQPAECAQNLGKRGVEETVGAYHWEDGEHDIADSAEQHRCARQSSDERIESAQKHNQTDEEEGDSDMHEPCNKSNGVIDGKGIGATE